MWVTGQLEDTHILMGRGFGVVALFCAVQYFLLRNSTDSTVQTSFLLSFNVALLCNFLACGYLLTHQPKSKKGQPKFAEKELTLMFYLTLLETAGSLFHLFRSSDWGGYGEITSRSNFHIRLQFVIMILLSVVGYAMPSWCIRMTFPSIEKVDSVLVFLVRQVSALNMGGSFLLLRVPNFLRTGDKESVLAAYWLFCAVGMSMDWVWIAFNWAQVTSGMIALELFTNIVFLGNMTGAIDYDFSVFQRVFIPKIKAAPGVIYNTFKLKRA